VAAIAEQPSLRRNEFAFHFETDNGVAVDMLATFLRRAATVARSRGADLRVVGVREGSLAITLSAIKKGAAKEFREKPIDTTVKVSALVVAVVGAIVAAMSLAKSGVSPLAAAAIELVDHQEVTQITIVTSEANTVLINKEIAKRVRCQCRLKSPQKCRLKIPHFVALWVELKDVCHGARSRQGTRAGARASVVQGSGVCTQRPYPCAGGQTMRR
jgi:hypothetical protein